MTTANYLPIGTLKTSFREKFGVPRQSGMVSEARAVLKLNPNSDYKLALNHLEDFSHLWIIFIFHKHLEMKWKPTITPPRVEAPNHIGVFASRSPHRPNPIGMSAVKLESIDWKAKDGIEIHLSGVDFLDETPVLDIKPYLPYTDCIPEAIGGWAEADITKYSVSFSDKAENILAQIENSNHQNIKKLLLEILQWDPRPTSQKRTHPIDNISSDGLKFAFRFLEYDIKWIIINKGIHIEELVKIL